MEEMNKIQNELKETKEGRNKKGDELSKINALNE